MSTSTSRLVLTASLVILLSACASGVTRMDSPAAAGGAATTATAKGSVGPVQGVNLWLNADAKKDLADNIKFNPDALRGTIERTLQARDLIQPGSGRTLDVEITAMRVRSNFSAVMLGFMAGADNVEGIVSIKDSSGQVLKKAKVNASYALGGLAGGQDDARMGWLYEKFAEHATAEVSDVAAN